jgi:hypothetical protein
MPDLMANVLKGIAASAAAAAVVPMNLRLEIVEFFI